MNTYKTNVAGFWKVFKPTSLIFIGIPFAYLCLQWLLFNFGGDPGTLIAGYFLVIPLLVYLYPPSLVLGKDIATECQGNGSVNSITDCILVFVFYVFLSVIISGIIYMLRKYKKTPR